MGGNTTEPVGNVVDTEKDTTNESDENTTIDEGEKSDVTDSEAEDELKWEYDYATKTIVISGTGPMKDYSENVPEWDEYCEKSEKVIIGDVAFQNALLHSDTGFKLPEGLLKIVNYAFYSAFKEGTVTIPSTVMSIGDHALSNIYVEGITVDENNQYYTSIDGK